MMRRFWLPSTRLSAPWEESRSLCICYETLISGPLCVFWLYRSKSSGAGGARPHSAKAAETPLSIHCWACSAVDVMMMPIMPAPFVMRLGDLSRRRGMTRSQSLTRMTLWGHGVAVSPADIPRHALVFPSNLV